MPTPVNGAHIASTGGIIQFIPFQGNGATSSTGSSAATGSIFVDVVDWDADMINFEDDTTDTGTWGYQGIDIPCQGLKFDANLVYDLTKPADLAQRAAIFGNAAALRSMNYGIQISLFIGNGTMIPENDTVAEWLFIPSCKVSHFHFKIDAGNKKMVRGRMQGISNSGFFHMPYDADALTEYVQHVLGRSRTF